MRALWALALVACGANPSQRSTTKRVLRLYTDGHERYVAVSFPARQLYFGDRGTFYEVRTYPARGSRLGFHDPRFLLPGLISARPDGIEIECLDQNRRWAPVPEDEAANAVLDQALFEGQRPTTTPLALGVARGLYIYLDVEGDERRMFMGTPGNMRQVKVLSDEGSLEAFTLRTQEGSLDVQVGDQGRMVWKGEPLSMIDPSAEWRLVFEQLKVYPARTPTPCDAVIR